MLTVLFATRDRAVLLRKVLEAFCRLRPPPSGWKLVVVDNGSRDGTAEAIASFKDRLPLQSIFEPAAGKNLALNTGLQLLEGDLTVLTDDDVFPHPDWLVELRRAADAQRDFSIFAGAILPRWEVPPPDWVKWTDPGPVYTLTDPTRPEGPLAPAMVFGPNMALRSGIFQSGIRFDPTMGPRGGSYPMGSETELVLRLARQGHSAWYAPAAVVEHFIRAEQLRKDWVLRRAIRYGRGKYRLACNPEAREASAQVPRRRFLVKKIAKEGLIIAAASVSVRSEKVFQARWRLNYWRGQLAEARILGRISRNHR